MDNAREAIEPWLETVIDRGERPHLSAKTVGTQRAQVMQRLEIFDVAGLMRYALRIGLIDPER